MTTESCVKLAEGETVRITKVDACGAPVAGVGNGAISDCWASVKAVPNLDNGTDIKMLNARGKTCGFKKACPTLLGFDLTVNFWEVSPSVMEILTGNPVYFDHAGNPVGWDDCSITCDSGFALELFQSILGEDCDASGNPEIFYWLYPWLTNGVLGEVTWDAAGASFTLTASTKAGGRWYLGPWDVQAQDGLNTPGPLLTPIGDTCHRRGFVTTIPAPDPTDCTLLTVPTDHS